MGGSGGALGELWEAQGQLWEALAELREALGELWEGLYKNSRSTAPADVMLILGIQRTKIYLCILNQLIQCIN